MIVVDKLGDAGFRPNNEPTTGTGEDGGAVHRGRRNIAAQLKLKRR